MSRKKYTHLFFDLDNTLWDFKANSRLAMHSTFQLMQLEEKGVDFEGFFDLYSKNNSDLWGAYRKKEIRKKDLTTQRFKLTLDKLEINGIDPAEMNALYLSEMPKQSKLVDGAIDLLDYLKNKNYQLFIITNGFSEVQYNKLKSSKLLPYFKKIFISEEIKAPKPAREIFEHAIKSANARKSTSLMIGDDLEVDVLGALCAGIDAVYVHHSNIPDVEMKHHKKLNKRYLAIAELQELKARL